MLLLVLLILNGGKWYSAPVTLSMVALSLAYFERRIRLLEERKELLVLLILNKCVREVHSCEAPLSLAYFERRFSV